MYIVYVLQNESGEQFVGHTRDLQKRLKEHESGAVTYTKLGEGWKLVYQEDYINRGEALDREKWLKTDSGKDWLNQTLGK